MSFPIKNGAAKPGMKLAAKPMSPMVAKPNAFEVEPSAPAPSPMSLDAALSAVKPKTPMKGMTGFANMPPDKC